MSGINLEFDYVDYDKIEEMAKILNLNPKNHILAWSKMGAPLPSSFDARLIMEAVCRVVKEIEDIVVEQKENLPEITSHRLLTGCTHIKRLVTGHVEHVQKEVGGCLNIIREHQEINGHKWMVPKTCEACDNFRNAYAEPSCRIGFDFDYDSIVNEHGYEAPCGRTLGDD